MWARLRAWTEDRVDAFLRNRAVQHVMAQVIPVGVLFVPFLLLLKQWVLLAVAALAIMAFVKGSRRIAQRRLRHAASLPLDHPRQCPDPIVWIGDVLPTASPLRRLALAVDAVRRDRLVEANDLLSEIDRERLRPEELRLLEAVRAIVMLGLGATSRAAELAILALPSGSEDLDARLGRLLLERAWGHEPRLLAIDKAWATAGVDRESGGTLSRLRRLVALRVFPDGPAASTMPHEEARVLAMEARAVGDEELAREIEVEAELRTARTYR